MELRGISLLNAAHRESSQHAAAGGAETAPPNTPPFTQVSSTEMPWFGGRSAENRL